MASQNQAPFIFSTPFAQNAEAGTKNTLPQTPSDAAEPYNASIQGGFPKITIMPEEKGGEPPAGQDFNGAFNAVSSHNFFQQNGGSYTFNPEVSSAIGGYPKNAVLWCFPSEDLPFPVVSLIDDNTYDFANDPSLIDGIHWSSIMANADLSNLTAAGNDKFVTKNTNQTISGVKTFSSGTLHTLDPLLLKQSDATEGGQINFERGESSVLSSNPYIDLNTNTIRVIGVSSQNATHITLKVDLENNQVLVPTPAANANDYQAATTYWCKTYIGAVDYSAGTDVTSSVFATSGTGYKPTKKGVLLIKVYNSLNICNVYIYKADGTQVFTNRWNDAPAPYNSAGGTTEILLDPNYSVRITANAATAGTNYWATFFPCA